MWLGLNGLQKQRESCDMAAIRLERQRKRQRTGHGGVTGGGSSSSSSSADDLSGHLGLSATTGVDGCSSTTTAEGAAGQAAAEREFARVLNKVWYG